MQLENVYITAAGKYLPGAPVHNDEIEEYLGMIDGKPSRSKTKMLSQNGIQSRYYALDKQQRTTHTVSGMAARAIEDCLSRNGASKTDIQLISAATTQSDLPVPGFASMVHADLGNPACEIASHQSVCAAGLMAIKNAYTNIQTGASHTAVACAGELASRLFKAKRFEQQQRIQDGHGLELETDFLRWMLSDGAGALLMQNRPAAQHISLQIEWIDLRSYAHLYEVCMYAGRNKGDAGTPPPSWMDYDSFSAADKDGALNLKQDLRLVDNMVKLGVQRFFELVDEGKFDAAGFDWLVCHYSSHHFKEKIIQLLAKGGVAIPEEKWFSNLYTVGNVGTASIFVLLEELLRSKPLKAGDKILCMVPESGRFITGFMMLTVVPPTASQTFDPSSLLTDIKAPEIRIQLENPVLEWLIRQLTTVWIDFESSLRQVPIVKKIFSGTLTLEEYKVLLFNLRQQVIDGSQWIARAASNVSIEHFDIRSSFISHSRDEHRDYQILEKNYIQCGGSLEELQRGEKNIGSEALSAYMFQRASQPDPFDLLGGMFIIEGLGNRVAGNWGRAIQQQLQLRDDQVSFFTYHETSDSNENHFERFENAIQSGLLTTSLAERIVKTAKVAGRLYRLQLEQIGNY
ncbi:3-oxoacyl-[acyl-carrier-protein] synthase-3 [Chitinophaga eiseniae]|uniref:3-oxoacyl-[acyl-carrier-protein] synthase-3 n=1 Tax=Chitinophaga eiseniae TaxID=634771 RepID=A0A1T4LWZ6_9BACT|nr:beta-ketoacyl-ACP synthase III [Chitinophaga eiseniae]SJZ59269.1 3-oxoacyl-[acyl-carrier-protein] synthase-3 [Chitinophaga eiseniae]